MTIEACSFKDAASAPPSPPMSTMRRPRAGTAGMFGEARLGEVARAVEMDLETWTGADRADRVLVALAEKFKLPVVAIGVGEGIDDLRPFEARAFARSLMGLAA